MISRVKVHEIILKIILKFKKEGEKTAHWTFSKFKVKVRVRVRFEQSLRQKGFMDGK